MVTRSQIKKNKVLDFLSALVKFCEVHVNFKTTSEFLFNFCIILHCLDTCNSNVNLKLIHFLLWTKASYQSSNFHTFECSGEDLQNSSCHFLSNKSFLVQILYPSSVSWKITPLCFFSSNNIYLAQKELIKMKVFEIFECSGQILSNSLSQFWNEESIPLQICISLQFHERLFLWTFLAQRIYIYILCSKGAY